MRGAGPGGDADGFACGWGEATVTGQGGIWADLEAKAGGGRVGCGGQGDLAVGGGADLDAGDGRCRVVALGLNAVVILCAIFAAAASCQQRNKQCAVHPFHVKDLNLKTS